jgi:hypothetical protein
LNQHFTQLIRALRKYILTVRVLPIKLGRHEHIRANRGPEKHDNLCRTELNCGSGPKQSSTRAEDQRNNHPWLRYLSSKRNNGIPIAKVANVLRPFLGQLLICQSTQFWRVFYGFRPKIEKYILEICVMWQ